MVVESASAVGRGTGSGYVLVVDGFFTFVLFRSFILLFGDTRDTRLVGNYAED